MRARNISCCGTSLGDERAELSHAIEKYADVAAHADHAKPLADPVGGGLGRGRQEAGSYSVPVTRRHQVIHGLQEAGMIELGGDPTGDGEVVVADPGDIDAGNGDD